MATEESSKRWEASLPTSGPKVRLDGTLVVRVASLSTAGLVATMATGEAELTATLQEATWAEAEVVAEEEVVEVAVEATSTVMKMVSLEGTIRMMMERLLVVALEEAKDSVKVAEVSSRVKASQVAGDKAQAIVQTGTERLDLRFQDFILSVN